jgi:adenosylcobinamide-GDP ribazoletransferase
LLIHFSFVTAFLLALQFLTRIPVLMPLTINDKQLGLSVLYYPVVGLLIGMMLLLLSNALTPVAIPAHAVLLLIFWVFITGGLHLDGLADCADAWAGGLGNPQRSLEIMKDPAAGSLAVITLVLLLLLKWTVLVELLTQQKLIGLVIVPMLGRCGILALMLITPYLRKNGLGSTLIQHLPKTAAKIMLISCFLLSVYSLGFLPVFLGGLMLVGIRKLALDRLGGVTGDVYGATVELVETAVLIGIVL